MLQELQLFAHISRIFHMFTPNTLIHLDVKGSSCGSVIVHFTWSVSQKKNGKILTVGQTNGIVTVSAI